MFGLWLALLVATLGNVALLGGLLARGDNAETAAQGIGLSLMPKLLERTGIDSWKPMALAFERIQKKPDEMYWVFFVKRMRFQYPPSALLVMNYIPVPLTMELREKLAAPSLAAVLATIVLSFFILSKQSSAFGADRADLRRSFVPLSALLVATLGLTFYPLLKGHNLGQIQVYLGAAISCALLAHVHGQRLLAGLCLGVCCLIKPQYGLVLVWAAWRREGRLLLGCLGALAVGGTLSLLQFGLHNHLQYLEVLRELSRHGESFWPNQSVNGLLHRVLQNGEPVKWLARELPPYHPIVYYGTLGSSLLLLGLSIFGPADRSWRGSVLDLSVLLAGATIASPIAWEHHYGAFFPIFAAVAPLVLASKVRSALLVVAYALLAVEFLRPELVFADRWTGLLGAHIFVGALLLFGVLVVTRARRTQLPAGAAG